MSTLTFRPAAALAGSVAVPPDKSLTHRAFLLGAISDRVVVVDMDDSILYVHGAF